MTTPTPTLIEALIALANDEQDKAAAHDLRLAASRLTELQDELVRLRAVASNADRAMRFVQLVAGQKRSEFAREWYAGEFGDEGEPDFEGAYDSFIQDARNILNDTSRAALDQQGERG